MKSRASSLALFVTSAFSPVTAAHEIDVVMEEIIRTEGAPESFAPMDDFGYPEILRLRYWLRRGETVQARGWAAVALARTGDRKAQKELWKRGMDRQTAALERTWCIAAWLRCAPLDEVLERFEKVQEIAGLDAVIEHRAREMPIGEWRTLAEKALEGRAVQTSMSPWITARGPAPLVDLTLNGNNGIRYRAAQWLGSMQRQGVDVATAFTDGLGFDARATRVPWDEGALWVPTMTIDRASGVHLAQTLLSWMLQREITGSKAARSSIDRALRMPPLVASLDVDWGVGTRVLTRLRAFDDACGEESVVAILVAQVPPDLDAKRAALAIDWITANEPPGALQALATLARKRAGDTGD